MDNRKRIIVDMDGVLADIYSQYIKLEFNETGKKIALEDTWGKSEVEAFPNSRKHLRTKGFFKNAPVISGAVETLQKLNERFELFIVSSATQFPNSLEEKYYWLEEHFPFITWQQLVLCGSKKVIKGDIMIDDHFKNLDSFEGRTILFTQPHNFGENENLHERVSGWEEIINILL